MRAVIIALLFIFLFANFLLGQTVELGGGIQFFRLKGNVLETNQLTNYNGPTTSQKKIFRITPAIDVEFGINFPVYEREKFAIGIQPEIIGNAMWFPENYLFAGTRGDLFVTGRFGSEASYANYVKDKRFFGFGAGYSFFEILDKDYEFSDKLAFFNPSLFLETGKNDRKVKLYVLLNSHYSNYKGYTGDIPKINYWEFGISIVHWGYFNKGE